MTGSFAELTRSPRRLAGPVLATVAAVGAMFVVTLLALGLAGQELGR